MKSDPLIQELSNIDTPTLANALEKLEVRHRIAGFADQNLKCIFPDLGTMCGFAVTAEVETMNPDITGVLDQPFFDLCALMQKSPKPTVVVFREIGMSSEFSAHCGEVMCTVFTRLGAVGLVSDSAVRDLPEVKQAGFHYFATGAVASHGNFRIVRANVPMTVCGLKIETGDLLHGDENGLIKVPEQGREKLPELAREVTQAERELMDYVKSDSFTLDGLKNKMTH